MSGTPLGIKVPTFMATLLCMAQDTTIRGGWALRTTRHRSRGDLHQSMTPFITAGVLVGAMGQDSCPVSTGGSRWESWFRRGGTAVIGQVGIPGMAMVTGTDTPGATVTGGDTLGTMAMAMGMDMTITDMMGIPDIMITRVMDKAAVIMEIAISRECISMPAPIVP